MLVPPVHPDTEVHSRQWGHFVVTCTLLPSAPGVATLPDDYSCTANQLLLKTSRVIHISLLLHPTERQPT